MRRYSFLLKHILLWPEKFRVYLSKISREDASIIYIQSVIVQIEFTPNLSVVQFYLLFIIIHGLIYYIRLFYLLFIFSNDRINSTELYWLRRRYRLS